jgi:hypothetical protein
MRINHFFTLQFINMRHLKLIFLFSIIFIFSSCLTKFFLNRMGVFDKKVFLKYITNGNKKIVFLPMHHIGTESFYKDEARLVDSLLKKGYTVFYEFVRKNNFSDSSYIDSLKFRKITGMPSKYKGNSTVYLDTINNTILGRKSKLVSNYKLKNQSVEYLKKYDTAIVKNIDTDMYNLIKAYEKKYGLINLEKIDFDIKLGEEYKMSEKSERKTFFMLESRNDIITKAILNETSNKIALIYGAAHYDGILKNLQAADKNYKVVDKL